MEMVSVPPEGDETTLILAARGGDTEAFGELVLRHQASLRAHAARFLHDPEAVQDLVQEAFVEGWRCLHRFDPTRPLRPWLRQILHHRVGNHLRSLARHRLVPMEVLDIATFPDQDEDGDDDAEAERMVRLGRCLDRLDARQRELVQARFAAAVPVQELARRLGTTAGAISMRLNRIFAALRRCFEEPPERSCDAG